MAILALSITSVSMKGGLFRPLPLHPNKLPLQLEHLHLR